MKYAWHDPPMCNMKKKMKEKAEEKRTMQFVVLLRA